MILWSINYFVDGFQKYQDLFSNQIMKIIFIIDASPLNKCLQFAQKEGKRGCNRCMQVIIKPTRRIQNTQLTRINILYTLYLQKIQQQQNMTKNKHITISLIPTLLICILMMWVGRTAEITGKVVEIEPVALDVIISIYDRAIILFNHGIVNSTTLLFEHSIKQFISAHPSLNFTRTIFGVCDLSKDQSGKLNKFGAKPSLQIITKVVNYQISFPSETSQISQFFSQKFSEFLQKHSSSKAPTISKNKLSQVPGFSILISPSSNENIQKSQRIHTQIFDYMNFFNTKLFINSQQSESNRIDIYLDGNIYSSYAQSAIDALFNFTISQQPHKQQINDFVDYVNIQTIANVTLLDQQNYYRVFGSSIEYQILFVYQEAERNTQKIQKILQQFQEASIRNRNEGLKYERVLFASGSTQFLDNYFSDTLLQPGQQYSILITKTDYSSFQLRKFIYQDSEVTSEKLIQFIHDVRMKKLNPKYKSEKIEDNSGKLIRKIVGDNFYDEIFQQSQKSVLVLFIDSKESQNGGKLGEALREFVEKNHGAYQEHMNVGIFDLAKNQHKSLTISTAPELILFERSNKKKPKFFKGAQTKETIKNWLNYEAKDFTIPQNYGEPPIALGGSQQL